MASTNQEPILTMRELTPLTDDQRAARRLRWANRKRVLAGEPPVLDPVKAKKRARRKEMKRRKTRWSKTRKRVGKADGRRAWVRKLKAEGKWLPVGLYRIEKETRRIDAIIASMERQR